MSFARTIKPMILVALGVALAGCLTLTGCGQPLEQQSSAEEEAVTSRSFMANVNEACVQLNEKMTSFTDAVAREDLVSRPRLIALLPSSIRYLSWNAPKS